MAQTKLKPTEKIGDNLPILSWQIKRIMQNCSYQVETKNEYVQWVTNDVNRTSLRSITQAEAKKIMRAQTGEPEQSENWAAFDNTNSKHKAILSLLYQAEWTTVHNYKTIPDLKRFSDWLKEGKAPIKKPILQMEPLELSKTIKALEGVVKSTL